MCWPSTEARRHRIAPLDASTYRRHSIHGEGRIWAETNCYTDLLVELVHGLGFEPRAMLPFTLAIDFEGDQWTFFKPQPADLSTLYGMELHELAIWRPLVEHVVEQVAAGHPVLAELDSWYLPDTAGTAYRLAHVKTTVAVNDIDVAARRMGYFHNAGYFELEGDDFREVFLLEGLPHERMLPPYVEFVKWRPAYSPPRETALVEASVAALKRELGRLPRANPFARFRERFQADLEWLLADTPAEAGMSRFHAYSFATLRQYGACFELAETYLRWLAANGVPGVAECAEPLRRIAETAKAFQFQLARAIARRKPIDLAPLEAMGADWSRALEPLAARFA